MNKLKKKSLKLAEAGLKKEVTSKCMSLRTFMDFPGVPVVKMLCFQCKGSRVLSPVRELRFPMPQCRKKFVIYGKRSKMST